MNAEEHNMDNIELKTDREVLISLAKDVQYIRKNIETLQSEQANTNRRVDKLEKWQAWAVAVAGAVAFIISILDDWFLKR